jgi:hypothetical protein
VYDLVFVGNASIDEIHPFRGQPQVLFGGGVAFGAMSAVWTGKRIAVVTRIAREDGERLEPLQASGIDVYPTYADETSRYLVRHLTADVDIRQVVMTGCAGRPTIDELDPISCRPGKTTFLHFAPLTGREASMDFLVEAVERGFSVSVDMQGFVRQADPETGEVSYEQVPAEREIVSMADRVKLDGLEARFLTGLSDPREAAIELERRGSRETMITWAEGVLVRTGGRTYFERFSNAGVSGRTGRGDTTFGSYLACRLDEGVAASLRLAATVASMKLEKAGSFTGTKEQIQTRMARRHG